MIVRNIPDHIDEVLEEFGVSLAQNDICSISYDERRSYDICWSNRIYQKRDAVDTKILAIAVRLSRPRK